MGIHSDRKVRLTELVKQLAATYIQREANTDPLITITNVEVSNDHKRAIIFFTTIPDGKEQDALIFLKRSGTGLRDYFKQKARIKHIPHLEFMIDAGEKHRQDMDELVKEIEEKKEEKESGETEEKE